MLKRSVYYTLGDIDDRHDVKAIKRELDTLPGVLSVSISNHSRRVAVDYDTTDVQSGRIEKQLKKMGYEIIDSKLDDHIM